MIKEIILEQLKKRQLTPEAAKALLTYQQQDQPRGDIAIIGMSCRFPGAKDADTFWHHLAKGTSFLGPLPTQRATVDFSSDVYGGFLDEDIHAFDAHFFDISDDEAQQMDPQQKYFLQCAWEAIENAGYIPSSLQHKKCGVYAAIGGGDHLLTQKTVTPYTAGGFLNSFLVSRLSYFLNLAAPCLVVDSACTSALSALHLARQSLLTQETDMMLVGSFNILSSSHVHSLCQHSGLLSNSHRCQPFSADADGWLPGEGGGVLVLKRLADAMNDGDPIYGVLKGSGVNHNGRSNGMQAPRASRQLALQQSVCAEAGVAPESIDYLEVQGVCHPIGDSIEFHAMQQGLDHCFVTTTKPNIGHLLAASGMAGVIKMLMSMKHQAIPPIASLQAVNPALEIEQGALVLNRHVTDWRSSHTPRRAAINGFGLTGVNAHLIFEEPPVVPVVRAPLRSCYVICFSAKESQKLPLYRKKLAEYLSNHPEISLPELALTLQTGREAFHYRDAIVAGTLAEVIEQLQQPSARTHLDMPNENEIDALLMKDDAISCQLLAHYWCMGHSVDWKKGWHHQAVRRIPLPGYPFESQALNQDVTADRVKLDASNDVSLRQRCEAYLADVICEQTGNRIEANHYHKNFINLGISSIQLLQLSDLLEKQSGVRLNTMVYFEHPNIQALAAYIMEHHTVTFTTFLSFYKSQETVFSESPLSSEEQHYLSLCKAIITLSSNRIATMSDILMQENTPENRERWPLKQELFDIANDFYQRFNVFAKEYLQGKELSRTFIHQLHQTMTHPLLIHSQLLKRFFEKPRGYAGDFETIKMMYDAQPKGETLLAFWLDQWAHQLDSMRSVQNRRMFIREQLKQMAQAQHDDDCLPVMSIACGPANELFESLSLDHVNLAAVCIDLDANALSFVQNTAQQQGVEAHITCVRENAFQLSEAFIHQYGTSQKLIYSIGLIDYFEDAFIVTLLNQLYHLLQPGGQVILGNICDQCPERYVSDYLLDWLIIYRTKEQMYDIFRQSYFHVSDIDVTVYNDDVHDIQLYALAKKHGA